MTKHRTGTRKEWLATRLELLEAEKELTRRSDELAQRRQELPWVRIDKGYRFETDEDGFSGFAVHLANHDVTLSAVSRAPLAKLQGYKRRMGWAFPWASSFGSDFNADFNIAFTEQQQREGGVEYNYRREPAMAPEPLAGKTAQESKSRGGEGPVAQIAASTGTDVAAFTRDRPGMSAFVIEDGLVYHTYSTYSRGLDGLWGMYQWLDRAPMGRNEKGVWMRRHDEYGER
jgi:predicted dithiol-disulfide oxidoreductase (DUF899 family)